MTVMVLLRGNEKTEVGEMPSEKMFKEMNQFNEELVDAGVMLGGDGLQPVSKDAIDWVKRIPNSDHEMNGKIDIPAL